MTGHPYVEHEAYADALAAHALGVLGPDERVALEAHLEGCAACRDELALQRAAAEALGRSLDPIAPPAALRARIIAEARERQEAPTRWSARTPVHQADTTRSGAWTSTSLAWLTTAAAAAVAIGAVIYAYALQREVAALTALAASASTTAETLRAEVVALRRQSSELVQVLNVIGAPDVRQASLSGNGAAAGALGRAYWSRSQGLVFKALQLPALAAGRDYQLWIVPPSGAPVSMGVLQVGADGSSSQATPLANLPAAAAVAVTIEPAGGSPSPTLPIVMVGNLVG